MLAHGRGHYSKACVLEIWLAKLKTTWHRIIWVKNIGQRQVRTHKYKISLLQKKSTKVTKKWPVNLFQYKKSPERMKSPLINYKIKAVNALNTVSFFSPLITINYLYWNCMARCQTCCRNCVLSTNKQKCMLFVPPQISLSVFLFKTLFHGGFYYSCEHK